MKKKLGLQKNIYSNFITFPNLPTIPQLGPSNSALLLFLLLLTHVVRW